jgi:hypothetical protein
VPFGTEAVEVNKFGEEVREVKRWDDGYFGVGGV